MHLAHADGGTLTGWLDHQWQAKTLGHGREIAFRMQHLEWRRGYAYALPQQLGAPFIHSQGAGQDTRTGIGDAHQLQRTLNSAVLAITTMQGDKGPVKATLGQLAQVLGLRIEGMRVHPTAKQGRQHHAATVERYLALGRASAKQHRNAAQGGRFGIDRTLV